MRVLGFLGAHVTAALAGGVFLGLLWPALAALLAPLLMPAVFVLLVATLLRLDWRAVAARAAAPGRTLAILAWLALGTSTITFAVLTALDAPAPLITAMVLAAASAPIVSSVPLAMLLGLDGALAAVAVIVTMVLLPLYLPPLALTLLGLNLGLGLWAFMARLGALVGGALAVAAVVRWRLTAQRLAAAGDAIDGIVVAMLIVFAIAIMNGVTAALFARPGIVLLYAGASFAANLGLQSLGTLIFLRLGRVAALTCGLVSGNRNMAILLAVMAGHANFDVTLYFAVGQLPIYLLPMMLRPVYRRFSTPRGERT